jgi:hypothetical protein
MPAVTAASVMDCVIPLPGPFVARRRIGPLRRSVVMRKLPRILPIASCALATCLAAAQSPTAVEFIQNDCGHYFVTASPSEVANLDGGVFPGWSRTGHEFEVFPAGTPGCAGVCRFWSGQTYAPKSSHFYTPYGGECAEVKTNPDWQFEGEVFALKLPDAAGTCTSGTVPLYRLYNAGKGGAPNHRYTTSLAVRAEMLAQGWMTEGTGTGIAGCAPVSSQLHSRQGRVVDGAIEGARVCLDVNRNGRCEAIEPQAMSDVDGTYQLAIPANSTDPLVAEVIAGHSRDADNAGITVEASYRMASPSQTYGTDITPYSTLVYLTRLDDYLLAEDLVRATLGLPPNFDLRMRAPPQPGTLGHSVAKWIVKALQARGDALELSAPNARDLVVGAFPSALSDLPQLAIATRDGVPITSKEDYVDATYVLTNPAAAVPAVTLNGKIRGRGNSTWGQPKNPYKVQFANDASFAAIGDVLGMKKQRNWALLADYFDRSLIRNKLVLSLGASSVFADGLKWTPVGQHVEVTLNGDYVGVYLLTEDIRIDPARLDIRKMSSKPVDGQFTGGYIVEVDVRLDCYKGDDLDLQRVTAKGVAFCVDTPDEEAITPAQLAYVKDLLQRVEDDLYGARRLDRLDPASFADWYLIQELIRNNDAIFLSSDFMWKDADDAARPRDRRLNMGPLWDFDRAAGNVNTNGNWQTEGCWVSKGYLPNWYSALFDIPDFKALVLSRWHQKRAALETFVNGSIDIYARRLLDAQHRNFQRWPIFGVALTNYYEFSSHDEEVAFVRRFLNERMAWMDKAFATPEAFDAMCR